MGLKDLGVGRAFDAHAGEAILPSNRTRRLWSSWGCTVPVWRMADQSFALGRVSAQADQICFGRRLDDEDLPRRLDTSLGTLPASAHLGDVQPVLFSHMARLFIGQVRLLCHQLF